MSTKNYRKFIGIISVISLLILSCNITSRVVPNHTEEPGVTAVPPAQANSATLAVSDNHGKVVFSEKGQADPVVVYV